LSKIQTKSRHPDILKCPDVRFLSGFWGLPDIFKNKNKKKQTCFQNSEIPGVAYICVTKKQTNYYNVSTSHQNCKHNTKHLAPSVG
jgi:hypothetical protein